MTHHIVSSGSCFFLLVTIAGFALRGGTTGGIRVSAFGYDAVDSTEIVQKALDSGATRVIFDRQLGPWIVRPVFARSNQELVFEEGAELVAKRGEYKAKHESMMNCVGVTNVVLRGLGKGATFRMWRADYQDTNRYVKSEWRHALRLVAVKNVTIENLRFRESGGDGIELGARGVANSTDVVIRKCICDSNHRQGISVCSADRLLIEDCVLANTKGTMPQAGIDIEPNEDWELARNIVLRNVVATNNAGSGIEVMFHRHTHKADPVSVRIENFHSRGNAIGAVVVGNHVREKNIVRGTVDFVNCSFANERRHALRIIGVPYDTLQVRFDDCTTDGVQNPENADVLMQAYGQDQGCPDFVEFNNLRVRKSNDAPWFAFKGRATGMAPTHFRGNVEVTSTNGAVERVSIDADWLKGQFPMAKPLLQ